MAGTESAGCAVRLLALDLDGTLVGEEARICDTGSVSPRVRQAIAAAQQHGVVVTLATGRMFEVAAPFAQKLAISAPLICYQGALIRASSASGPLFVTRMDTALMREVLEWSASRDWHVVLYSESQAFATRAEHPEVFRDVLAQETVVLVDNLPTTLDHHQPVKFIVIDEPGAANEIEAELRDRVGHRMAVVRSHRSVVEGYPLGVSKGEALRRLAGHLSVPRAQTMAIGDRDNDVSMVSWAGIGVAMGSGSPALQAAADWVAPPLAEDGAAAAIERFVLGYVPGASAGTWELVALPRRA